MAAIAAFVGLPTLNATAWIAGLPLDRPKAWGPELATVSGRLPWLSAIGASQPAALLSNPFTKVPKADEKADPPPKTPGDDRSRVDAALGRGTPPAAVGRNDGSPGKREGEAVGKLRDETCRRLERLGQERALIYKTLVLTGLRKGELASITVGQVGSMPTRPTWCSNAADEKNREGSTIPLRADLAADLRRWLADKATALQEAARAAPAVRFDSKHQKRQKRNQGDSTGPEGQSCLPLTTVPTLPTDTPLFTVPAGLVRILDRDLVAAGIARRVEVSPGKWKIDKRDERGRTVDVHALRHTFGTLLSKGGVAPRTAQAAMRHSDHRLDHERLHRSEAVGRGRGDGIAAGAPPRGWKANGGRTS